MPATKSVLAAAADSQAGARVANRFALAALAKEKKMALYWTALAAALYCDTMATYFARTLTGAGFPYSALMLMLFVVGLFVVGYPKIKLPLYGYIAIYLLVLSFSISILSLEEFELSRFRQLAGAIVALGIGYACFTAAKTENQIRFVFSFVSLSYAIVCFIALRKIYPALFPVINTIGNRAGEVVIRPEVTTDQNFQIFYLLPIAMLLALENSTRRLVTIFVVSAVSAYCLSELQTRSGSLVLVATLAMSAIVGMRSRGKFDWRLVALVFLGLVGSLAFLQKIIAVFEKLIERFTVADFDTLEYRTNNFLFTFQHLLDVDWWLPSGYLAYLRTVPNAHALPHSNITAIFVETGLFGLIGWILGFVLPLVVLGYYWIKKRTSPIADVALCGGVSTLVIQLSLNAPLFELVWFWAGAVLAAVARCKWAVAAQTGRDADASPTVSPDEGAPAAAVVDGNRTASADAAPKTKTNGLRKIETGGLKRVDTSPRARPDTRLKRQRSTLKPPPGRE